MTTVRYVRRPHRAGHQCFEYQRASRDWSVWRHVAYFVGLILALIVAVQCAGGTLAIGPQ